MAKVIVLGAGLVGRHVARDLATSFDVTAVDAREVSFRDPAAGAGVTWEVRDLSEVDALPGLLAGFDLVVDALPGRMGFAVLEAAIDAKTPIVDIAFMPEDPRVLNDRAASAGVPAIVDMGVAPGMSNAILGHHVATMGSVETFECLVGGLPTERVWPFEYKAPFSPADVLEEYTRPARYVEHGVQVTRTALTDPERVEFDGIGTLESLNTDGLRTLLHTMPVPDMKEKTLRYPGHGRLMEAFREAGFLDQTPVAVDGVEIRPRDLTSALLFDAWKLEEGDPEFTVMRVTVKGTTQDGARQRTVWDLLDRGDDTTGMSSMARTTGFPCAAAVHLILSGRWRAPGVTTPEHLAQDREAFAFLLAYQEERGVTYQRTVS